MERRRPTAATRISLKEIKDKAESYNEYLQSGHWERIRKYMLDKYQECQLCGNKRKHMEIHHRYYKDKETSNSILYCENEADLMVLCRKCHSLIHRYKDIESELDHMKLQDGRRAVIRDVDMRYNSRYFVCFWNNQDKRYTLALLDGYDWCHILYFCGSHENGPNDTWVADQLSTFYNREDNGPLMSLLDSEVQFICEDLGLSVNNVKKDSLGRSYYVGDLQQI